MGCTFGVHIREVHICTFGSTFGSAHLGAHLGCTFADLGAHLGVHIWCTLRVHVWGLHVWTFGVHESVDRRSRRVEQ